MKRQTEAGNAIPLLDDTNIVGVIEKLRMEAACELPPNTRCEIRRQFGGRRGVAWYWNVEMAAHGTDEEWLAEPPGERTGYILVGRFITQRSEEHGQRRREND